MRQVKEKIMSDEAIFVNLTEANFQREVLECEQPVLVKFGAEWLATSHMMAPILDELCCDFKGLVKFGAIDVDRNEKLVREYGIVNLPAFVLFKGGQAVDQIIGAAPKNEFVTKIAKLF